MIAITSASGTDSDRGNRVIILTFLTFGIAPKISLGGGDIICVKYWE